jgi:hypothetical protein
MRTPLLLLLLALLSLIKACTSSSARQSTGINLPSLPLLHLQKTPCLGTCPAYNAIIYEDGSISYVAFRRALAQDTLHFTLTGQEVQQLQQKLQALHYKQLQNAYLTQWSDMSATYITFYEAGKEVKRVKHQEGGPEQLIQFQEWLHQLVWQRAEELAKPTH